MFLLLLCALPLTVRAQVVSIPFMCIEKTNGEVIKVRITETTPNIWYTTVDEDETKRSAMTISTEDDVLTLFCDEVKRFYTIFEEVDAVAELATETKSHTMEVFSASGLRMGNTNTLKRLPRGVYLVKAGSRTIKHINR